MYNNFMKILCELLVVKVVKIICLDNSLNHNSNASSQSHIKVEMIEL